MELVHGANHLQRRQQLHEVHEARRQQQYKLSLRLRHARLRLHFSGTAQACQGGVTTERGSNEGSVCLLAMFTS